MQYTRIGVSASVSATLQSASNNSIVFSEFQVFFRTRFHPL